MRPKYAPDPTCDPPCEVCVWARRKAEREQAKQDDLELNYQRYEAGLLVAKDDRE